MLSFPLKTEAPRVRTLRPLVTAAAADFAQSVVATDVDFATIAKPTRALVCSYAPPFVPDSTSLAAPVACCSIHSSTHSRVVRMSPRSIETHGLQLSGADGLVDFFRARADVCGRAFRDHHRESVAGFDRGLLDGSGARAVGSMPNLLARSRAPRSARSRVPLQPCDRSTQVSGESARRAADASMIELATPRTRCRWCRGTRKACIGGPR